MVKTALLMVILKMLFPKRFGSELFLLLKEFHEVRGVFEVEPISDLVNMTVSVQQQTTRFPHDKFIEDFAGTLVDGLAAGGIEVLMSSVQLLCQHTDFSLDVGTGEQEVDEAGVQLSLYACVQEAVTSFFEQAGYQAFQQAVDAMMLIWGRGGGLGHQEREQGSQVSHLFQVKTVGMPYEMKELFQRLITALLKKSVLKDDDISIRLIMQLPIMHLVAIEEKEHRRFDVITMSVNPMVATAAGQKHDLEILLMLMRRGNERTLAKGLDLYMFFRTDLIFCWNKLFQENEMITAS